MQTELNALQIAACIAAIVSAVAGVAMIALKLYLG
jgi:hypothetical protein